MIDFLFLGMCILKLTLDGETFAIPSGFKYYLSLCTSVMFLVLGAFIFGVVLTQSLWEDFVPQSTKL